MIQTSLCDVPYLTKLKVCNPLLKESAGMNPLKKGKYPPVSQIREAQRLLNIFKLSRDVFSITLRKAFRSSFNGSNPMNQKPAIIQKIIAGFFIA